MRTGLTASLLMGLAFPVAGQERVLIYVDPGHGGDQPGVVVDGLEEADLVLRLGFLVAEAFAEAGYETRMSRTGDEGHSFQERVDEAREVGAALFLSLHMMRNDDPAVWGTQIFLAEELAPSVRAAESIGSALESIGAQVTLVGQPWDVLKSADFPTLMIELGHLTHPVERRLMTSRGYWEQVATALVSAVGEFLGDGRH